MYRHPGIVGEGADGLPLDIGGAGVRVQYHVVPIISPAGAVATEQEGGSGQTIHIDGKRLVALHRAAGQGIIAQELGHRRGEAAREIIIRSIVVVAELGSLVALGPLALYQRLHPQVRDALQAGA